MRYGNVKRLTTATLAALCLVAGLMVVTPAWSAEALACVLVAGRPYKSGVNVESKYGRTGCANPATVTGKLKHQKVGPDSVLDQETRSLSNSTRLLSHRCLDSGAVYYTETFSSTGASATSSTSQACG